MHSETNENLWKLGLASIQGLETERGILASGRNEVYGCIFGRDSLITSLFLLRVYSKNKDGYFLHLVKKILLNLAQLQGKEVNIESGEEPGKMIHEYRPSQHDHLTKFDWKKDTPWYNPWYLYPDDVLRNYDSVDATPLFLWATYEYWKQSGDIEFMLQITPCIQAGLEWVIKYGDKNGDGFVDYQFHPDRHYGGLRTQSWMDSSESLFYESDPTTPPYPIAPVEVQAYVYVALLKWGKYFDRTDLIAKAMKLKERFNATFIVEKHARVTLGFALDGNHRLLQSARSSIGHVLWAADEGDSILETKYVQKIVRRLMRKDMFVYRAGIRTLSSRSSHFDPLSYHNGSIWPHDTAICAEGMENFGYTEEARVVREGLLNAYNHFATPIEMFTWNEGRFNEYKDPYHGQGACRVQAWSAASLLSILTSI
jgi:glycogen debranching enzyme